MNLRTFAAIVCFQLSTVVATLHIFEPPDFNVTTALIKQGINISDIPLQKNMQFSHRRLDPCSIAVSDTIDTNLATLTS
jgi:hypothetical protein